MTTNCQPGTTSLRRTPRDVDSLIRELQRINLSQCIDQLHSDIGHLDSIERHMDVSSLRRRLFVRCTPAEKPVEKRPSSTECGHGTETGYKKTGSSSGYSTSSGSPPASSASDDGCHSSVPDHVIADRHCAAPECHVPACRNRLCDEAIPAQQSQRNSEDSHYTTPKYFGFASSMRELQSLQPRALSMHRFRNDSTGLSRTAGKNDSAILIKSSFCPPSTSTPTLDSNLIRSPKTLRFAEDEKLVLSGVSERRHVSTTPLQGILRTSRSKADNSRQTSTLKHTKDAIATVHRHGSFPRPVLRSRAESPSPESVRRASSRGRSQCSQRANRLVSLLSQLEDDLSRAHEDAPDSSAACRLSDTNLATSTTQQRHLSFSGTRSSSYSFDRGRLPSASATDVECSSDDDREDITAAPLLIRGRSFHEDLTSELDSDSRRPSQRLPPVHPHREQRSSGQKFSHLLLSCGSGRRPCSPVAAACSNPTISDDALRQRHSGPVLYQCNLCQLRFSTRYQLVTHAHDRHVRVHVRPKYRCALCPARFYASRVLAKHCAFHHSGAAEDSRLPHCLSDYPQSR